MTKNPHHNLISRAGRWLVPFLLVVCFMLGWLLAPATLKPSQADPLAGVVSIDPPSLQLVPGTTGTVDIRSDGLTNIYGAQFTLEFDPTLLQAVDADGDPGNGVQIAPGTCPAPDFVVTNSADNAAGTVDYGATQVSPTLPCDGGVIAFIEFICLDAGPAPVTVPITITSSVISNPDAISLEHTTLHGQIICSTDCSLSGYALPQGHPGDATGVQICLDGLDCFSTGADGYFSLVLPDAEPHTLTADFIHHLAAERTVACGESGMSIETTTLRAGDLNQDGTINILDLVMVGASFGLTAPTNWSGTVPASTSTPAPTSTPSPTSTPGSPGPTLTPSPTYTPTYTPTPSIPTSTPEPPTPTPGPP